MLGEHAWLAIRAVYVITQEERTMKKAAAAVIGVLACVATGQVFADAAITSAFRGIEANLDTFVDNAFTSSTSGSFSDAVSINLNDDSASADQDSTIGILQFEGTGHADIQGSSAAAISASGYSVDFDLSVTHAYSLSGLLNEFVEFGFGGIVITNFQLIGPGTNISLSATTNGGDLDLASSGFLGPGSYDLDVSVSAFGDPGSPYSAQGTFDFDLTLRVGQVPEPSTLALIAFGLASLGFFSRRKHAS